MKIGVAQTRPLKGDIEANIANHKKLVELAVSYGAHIIIFPELSITGYEPELANELATDVSDTRFDDFRRISDSAQIVIGVGIPTTHEKGICISMVLFHPHRPAQIYSKKYLHSDEEEFFVSGKNNTCLLEANNKIALAICYELSVVEHIETAYRNRAEIYIASAVKSVKGVEKALDRLSAIANKYSMTVLFSNCVGESGGEECGGKSSIWNSRGLLLGQLDEKNEGILIIDTDTEQISKKLLAPEFSEKDG